VQIAPVIRPEENLPRTLGDVLHPLEAAYPNFPITPPARKPIAVLHVELLGRGPEARGLGAAGRFPQWTRRAAMSDYDFKAARKEELERRLATARRVAALPVDPLSRERVDGFIQELEAELGKGSAEIGRW
jgi:hypothetical protein